MAVKWNLTLVKEELIKIHGDKYDYSHFTEYRNLWQEIKVHCNTCNKPFTPFLNNHLKKKTGCPICGKIKAKTTKQTKGPNKTFDSFLVEFREVHGDKYTYFPETYKGSVEPMEMYCPVHDKKFSQKPANHKNGKGCPDCGNESMKNKLRFTSEELKDSLSKVHNYTYDESTYINTKEPMKFFCEIHGEFWQRPMNQLRQGAGCPKCSTTKAIKELIDLYPGFIVNDRTLIDPLEIDLLYPTKNFGIEYNGWLWHSFGKTFPNNSNNIIKNKQQIKNDKLEELDYQLFHILDIDWNDPIKKEIWKSVINSKFGITQRIFARKTKVIDLTHHRDFVKSYLTTNHLQGVGNYKLAYGLINIKNEVMAIMTFGKPIEDSSDWEIKRFCNFRNTTVVGGASKLLKHFERNHNPKSIISYAKRDWSRGKVYESIGFTLIGKTEPSKFYIKNDIKFSRQKFQKYKLQDRIKDGSLEHLNGGSTEDILFNNNYRVYYDSGNLKYKKVYDDRTTSNR